MTANRQFRLKQRPQGRVTAADFDFASPPAADPGPGEIQVRTELLSLDPTNRIWMTDMPQYMPPVQIGEVMRGGGLGRVVASQAEGFAPGDLVTGLLGWQDYYTGPPVGVQVLPPGLKLPPEVLLGACGMTGITAYFGLREIGQPKPGETVVVSAAAGAVGSIVGQIAKIMGCRAVGIAGGAEKCAWLVDELGFDAAVDYKQPEWRAALKAAVPDGVDINFENVGGEVMAGVTTRMNLFGRVVLCGMISGYNEARPSLGDYGSILMRRLRVQGFIVTDFAPRWGEAAGQLAHWIGEGRIKHRETVVDGLEHAPEVLNRLFDGGNFGKLMIRVAG